MADETQTDMTETQSSQTPAPTNDAPASGADGGADATQPAVGAADDDSSLLGNAATATGSGDGGADAGADDKDAGAGKDGEGETVAAPEAYELKVTTKDAEGNDTEVEIDTALLETATPILKELGLTNEQANKLAPLALEVQNRMLQSQADNYAAMKADWAKQAMSDKDIGGANWATTEALAAKALDQFGAPKGSEFRQLLDDTGLGNHPALIRMFRDIGKAVGEDSDVPRTQVSGKPDRLEVLYPDDLPGKSKQGAK